MTSLFRFGDFTLHSGAPSSFKIDCDALTADDWDALAAMAAEILPGFGQVVGVPKGGLPFAAALQWCSDSSGPLLIVDDVLTTGASMERIRDGRPAIGVVVFARGPCPSWVMPLFTANPLLMDGGRKP